MIARLPDGGNFNQSDELTKLDPPTRGSSRHFFVFRERWPEPPFARVPLTLAHLPLFHRRLDG